MTSTTFFIIFIPILALLLLFINLVLAPHNPYQEKNSAFECGYHSFLGQNRTQFSVSFFIFALLFLLFDLEILLVYPYSVSSYNNDIYGLIIMMLFFIALTLGFIFELGKNALTIDSRQTVLYNQDDKDVPTIFIPNESKSEFIKNIISMSLPSGFNLLNIFKNKTLQKTFIIFLVGLLSRIFINNLYEINVFKEYMNIISLIFYSYMAVFTALIYELPSINLKIFNISVVKNVIKHVLQNNTIKDAVRNNTALTMDAPGGSS